MPLFPLRSRRTRRRALLVAVAVCSVAAAAPGPAFGAFGLSKLTLSSKNGSQNYQYTAGNTVYASGTADTPDAATPGRRYRLLFRAPSGATQSTTACTRATGQGSVASTYTVQSADPVSTSAMWTAVLQQYRDTNCATVEKTASLPFGVARASAFATAALTTPKAFFGAGSAAYLRLAGLTPGGNDWSVSWQRPNGTTACANTQGGDRPDSGADGALPSLAGGFLQYQPGADGDDWNRQANYDGACAAATTQGAWKVLVARDATHFVTLPAFSIDATAPISSGVSPQYSRSSTLTVSYSASDTGGSGLATVDLYAKGPGDVGFTKAATASSPAASGSFTYLVTGVDGAYSFYTVATDGAGSAEPVPAAPDSTTVVDRLAPVSSAASPASSTAGELAVSYTASDAAAGLATVELFAKGPTDNAYVKVATDSAPAASGSFAYTAAQGNGSYSFYTVASDRAGNVEAPPASPDATTVVAIDTTAPASSATAPQYSTSPSITVSYTAADPGAGASGLAKVELYAKGPGDPGFANVATDSAPGVAGSFSYTASAGDGSYGFFTVATDAAGNVEAAPASADSSTAVDTGAPSSAASSPASSSSTSFTVSYTAADPGAAAASGLATVELYAKGPSDSGYTKASTDSAPSSSGAFSYTATQGTGSYSFYTVATDSAGNAEPEPATADSVTALDTTPGPGPTLYVAKNDPGCADSGSGTAARPFCSITPAATQATAGQTVRVSEGTYGERVTVANSGTPAAPVNFVAAPGESVTVTGGTNGFYIAAKSNVIVQGFTVTDTSADGIVLKDSTNITLRGNRVTKAGKPVIGEASKGVRVENTADSVIADNTVDHNSNYGIYLTGSTGNEVVGNRVFANARGYERAGSGIRVYVSTGNTVASNVSHDNEDSGVELVNTANDNLVVNNITYGNGDHGVDVTQGSLRARLIGNSVYTSVTSGLNVEGGSTGAAVINNVAVDNATNSPRGTGNVRVDSTSTSGTIVDYNVVWQSSSGRNYEWAGLGYNTIEQLRTVSGQEAHGIQANPRWASPAGGDFALTAGSPAIDSADSGASGQLGDDAVQHPRLDDPGTPNSGAGPRAYDDRGALEYEPGNRAPVPALTVSPSSGTVDLSVTADASESVDNDGIAPIASYTFDWGDGSTTTGPQAAPTADHTYRAAGSYTVTVTVTDSGDESAQATSTVTVADDPPLADLVVTPSVGHAPLDVVADASGSVDDDGTPIAGYRFDWGDGSSVTGPQSGATAGHTYDSIGTYTVTVVVTDTAGHTSEATASVTVHGDNVPPTAALTVTPSSGLVDLEVTADASASTDPDDGIAEYAFAWGDGTEGSGPQAQPTATHTYRAEGTHTITVTVTDAGGGSSRTTAKVTVQDLPPAARLAVSPTSGMAPLEISADASESSDTDGTPIAAYAFDWGDGTAVSGPQVSATATHTYAAPGDYTVTLTVTDTAGHSATATAQVSARPNLVTNWGFENNLTGWNTSGSSSAGVTLGRVAGGHSGSWAAQLVNTTTAVATCTLNDSPDWARPTEAGEYTGALWVRSDTAGATLKLRFTEWSGTVKVGSALTQVSLTSAWQKLSVSYTTVAPGSSLDLNAYVVGAAPGPCFYADDASIDLN